jgi:hypothetical protein
MWRRRSVWERHGSDELAWKSLGGISTFTTLRTAVSIPSVE